uniref:Ig-like domain-containing protein n=1 Tax=Chelonoidis abingdonii TaxID=106734 RepID=A0A8C0HA62_CHEAB
IPVPSASPHKSCAPVFPTLSDSPFLTASVLGSCLHPALAQTPVTITPPSLALGGGISLALENLPQDVLACSWYQAATADEDSWILTYYPQTPPGSDPRPGLHIAGLKLTDAGFYMVQIQSPTNPPHSGSAHLCSPSADTELWLRDGASLVPSERLGLSSDNRTLTVLGVTRSDAGTYQCEVGNPVSTNRSEPSTVTLVCLSARVVTGIIIGRTGAKGLSALGAWPFCCPTYWSPGSAVLPATSQLLPRLRWSCCSPACGWSTTAARATDPLQAPLRQLHQSHGPADPPQAPLRQLHQSRGPANPPQAPLRQLHRSCGPANPPQAPLRQLHRSCGPADPPQAPLRQLHRSRGPADPPQAPLRQLHRSRLLPFRQNAAA